MNLITAFYSSGKLSMNCFQADNLAAGTAGISGDYPVMADYFASLRLLRGVDRVPRCNEGIAMSQNSVNLMQVFRLATREVKPHCDAAATQVAALHEFAERLRKEGWQTRDVDLFVVAIRRLVLIHPS